MIMMLDEQGCGASNACDELHEIGAKLLRRAQESGGVRADTEIDDSSIGQCHRPRTEDAPDRERQSDRLFALIVQGLKPRKRDGRAMHRRLQLLEACEVVTKTVSPSRSSVICHSRSTSAQAASLASNSSADSAFATSMRPPPFME